jgi:hypothetical protein
VAVKTFLKNIVDFAKKDSHGWVAVLLIERKVYKTEMHKHQSGPPKLDDGANLMGKMDSLQVNEHLQGYAVARYLINEVFRPNFPRSMRCPMPNPSQVHKYNCPRRP